MSNTCTCCNRQWDEIAQTAHKRQAEMWHAIKLHLRVSDFARVSPGAICLAKQELGYPLSVEDKDTLWRYLSNRPVVQPSVPASSADDSWNDPDR